jgi:hypothetical protein
LDDSDSIIDGLNGRKGDLSARKKGPKQSLTKLQVSVTLSCWHYSFGSQEEILYAIDTINLYYFVDLGGVYYYGINFEHLLEGGATTFPLKNAAIKGQ